MARTVTAKLQKSEQGMTSIFGIGSKNVEKCFQTTLRS